MSGPARRHGGGTARRPDRSGGNTPCPTPFIVWRCAAHRRSQQRLLGLRREDHEVLCRFNTGGSFGAGIVTRTIRSNMWRRPRVRFRPSLEGRDSGNCRLRTSLGAPHDAWVKSSSAKRAAVRPRARRHRPRPRPASSRFAPKGDLNARGWKLKPAAMSASSAALARPSARTRTFNTHSPA
jgi:hypothetical protein